MAATHSLEYAAIAIVIIIKVILFSIDAVAVATVHHMMLTDIVLIAISFVIWL